MLIQELGRLATPCPTDDILKPFHKRVIPTKALQLLQFWRNKSLIIEFKELEENVRLSRNQHKFIETYVQGSISRNHSRKQERQHTFHLMHKEAYLEIIHRNLCVQRNSVPFRNNSNHQSKTTLNPIS